MIAWRGPDSKASELIQCPWCLSIWVAAAAVPTASFAGDSLWFQIPAAILTISYLYAMVAQLLDH
ncbi:DUF1360 domain-containing protein [Streptomyces sp. TR02-1]|uniref:DUF1360 domain-containing protein n=1 Tax=Streptomyces sp. TR02-1 TaxID=3385977 RepID=UPI0039A33C53